ncbi:hypothetical protein D9M72_513340 [compost metagenome]
MQPGVAPGHAQYAVRSVVAKDVNLAGLAIEADRVVGVSEEVVAEQIPPHQVRKKSKYRHPHNHNGVR